MTDFEDRLSEVLARKSAGVPPVQGLDEAARARYHRRRQTRVALVAAVATGAVLTTAGLLTTQDTSPTGETATTPLPSATPTDAGSSTKSPSPQDASPSTPTDSNTTALPCNPGQGSPQAQTGCPDSRPTTGWLTVSQNGDLFIRTFETLHNDADGRAFARREGLEFPFANDYLDFPDGSSQTLQLDTGTVCSGIIQVDYRSPLADHLVECAALINAARAHQVPVAIWRDGRSIVQVSELYRP